MDPADNRDGGAGLFKGGVPKASALKVPKQAKTPRFNTNHQSSKGVQNGNGY